LTTLFVHGRGIGHPCDNAMLLKTSKRPLRTQFCGHRRSLINGAAVAYLILTASLYKYSDF